MSLHYLYTMLLHYTACSHRLVYTKSDGRTKALPYDISINRRRERQFLMFRKIYKLTVCRKRQTLRNVHID